VAADINDAGLIVGSSGDHPQWTSSHAFLYRDREMFDLNDLIEDPDNEWDVLLEAYAINDKNEIVGYGLTADGQISAFVLVPEEEPAVQFIRGDANDDGQHNISDAIFILSYLFSGGDDPDCVKSTDLNDNSTVDIADAIYILGFLFSEGAPPAAPFEVCGEDPTEDELTCESFDACE